MQTTLKLEVPLKHEQVNNQVNPCTPGDLLDRSLTYVVFTCDAFENIFVNH